MERACLYALITDLKAYYGSLRWWPGTPDEIIIGSVLTQQTRWKYVETALSHLRDLGICSIQDIYSADIQEIEEAVRCTGFYRLKIRRIKGLAAHIIERYGGVSGMETVDTHSLREDLLSVPGVGPETADSILCYALSRSSFVIDAYTMRICTCAGISADKKELKALFEEILPHESGIYRESHAWFVEYAKEYCVKKRCDECRIQKLRE